MAKKGSPVPKPKNLKSFQVDFDTAIAQGVSYHGCRTVQARDQKDAVEVCHKELASEYGRTQWCMPLDVLAVKEV